MRRLLASVSEVVLLAILEADDRASEAFDRAREKVEEYAAAVDAAAAQVAAATAEMDAATDGLSNDMDSSFRDSGQSWDEFVHTVEGDEQIWPAVDEDLENIAHTADRLRGSVDELNPSLQSLHDIADSGVDGFEQFRGSLNDVNEGTDLFREHIIGSQDDFDKFAHGVDDPSHFERFEAGLRDVMSKLDPLGSKLGDTAKKFSLFGHMTTNAGNEAEDAANKAGGSIGKWQLIGGAIAALAGPLQGLIALTPATFFLVLGTAATGLKNKLDQLQASGQKLTAMQKAELAAVTPIAGAYAKLQPVIARVAQGFASMIKSVGPQLSKAFSALGPQITTLGGGLTNFVKILITGLGPQVSRMAPVMTAFSAGLSNVAQAIVHVVSSINVGDAVNGLNALFQTGEQLIDTLSTLMNVLSPLSSALIKGLAGPVLTVANEFLNALGPALRAIGTLMAPIGALVQRLGAAFLPLVKTISSVVVSLAGALVPVIVRLSPLLGQVASIVGGVLMQALKILLPAIMPLIPPLGQLAGAILQALVSVLVALEPGILAIVTAFVALIPPLLPILKSLTQLVQILTPIITLVAKVAALFLGPMAQALTLTETALEHGLVPIIQAVGRVFQDWFSSVKKLIGDLKTIFQGLIEFFTGVFTGNWSKAWDGLKKIFKGAVDYVKDLVKGFIQIGKDIINGVIHGIESAAGALFDKVKSIASGIVGGFKSALSILSPSRVMADEIGAFIPSGIAQGMLANAHLVNTAASLIGKQAVQGAQVGVNVGMSGGLSAGGAMSSQNNNRPIQFVMTGNQLMSDRDMEQFVNKMGQPLVNMLQRAGVNIRK